MKRGMERRQDSFLLQVPLSLLKSPDLGMRYPPHLRQPGCSFRGDKLWDEQKPGLHMCSFLCILLLKLMIVGLPHSLCHGPAHSPQELAPCTASSEGSLFTKEAGRL